MSTPADDQERWVYPYTPTVRQAALHQCGAQEVLFGGSAGPGKTEALLAAGVTFCLLIPNGRVFLFRRTFRMLDLEILPRLLARIPDHVARYRAQDHSFTFRNGAIFRLGYLSNDADLMNYQGVEIHLALFDELTQFTRYQYTYIRSRLRMAGQVAADMRARGWTPRLMSTSNPTGPGHSWVRAMFVSPSPGADRVFNGGLEEGEPLDGLRTLAYLPALPVDNPHLDLAAYRRQLAGLDPVLRRALEMGNWDVMQGVRWPQFQRSIHTIDPGQLPIPLGGYPRVVGVDYGLAAPFAAVWLALLPDNLVVAYRSLHRAELTADQQAALILASEAPGEREIYRPVPVALDPSCWARPSDQVVKPIDPTMPARGSVAWFYRQRLGGAVTKADNQRLAGWHLIDHHLRVRPDGLPRLLIYSTCTDLIRTLPEQMRSISNPEDIDCFVAGTMIGTPFGARAVETIRVGDLVDTPIGPQRVLKARPERSVRVARVEFSNGAVLEGTANHEVVTCRGLVALDSLRPDDRIITDTDGEGHWQAMRATPWSTGGTHTEDSQAGPTISRPHGQSLSGIARHCTATFTATTSVRFPPAGTFITSTMTPKIMTPRTLASSEHPIMPNTTTTTGTTCGPLRVHGSRPQKGKLLSGPTLRGYAPRWLREIERARIVAALSDPIQVLRSTVRLTASTEADGQLPTSGGAQFAVASSVGKPADGTSLRPAPMRVDGNYADATVYALTVDGCGLYYANGMICTNTHGDDHDVDALRYGLMHLLGGGSRRVAPDVHAPLPVRDDEFDVNLLGGEHRRRMDGILNDARRNPWGPRAAGVTS